MRILFIALIALAACSPYALPDPPPETERGAVTLNPSEAQRESTERFAEARRTILSLYETLETADWEAASALLSHETKLLLGQGDASQASAALASGRVTVEGASYDFDPLTLFLIPSPDAFEDDWEEAEQHETSRRKEVFIVSGEDSRRVVVIYEADAWRLHLREWPMDRLREGGG